MIFMIYMFRFKEYSTDKKHRDEVDKVISCMEKHTWYLDSALVPLALLDDEVPATEKIAIATKLLGNKVYYTNFGLENVDIKNKLNFGDILPSMSNLIDKYSYFMFDNLGITKTQLEDRRSF